ncbi:hypothetical protein X777_04806 [Ooceraea biroi]|uniref:Uncharacterized protein n=1 Tax=Ooceraea biroi TaxID=2015173 RepID=A0A026WHB1_OOCBI|nr:hypothetical protein X777_04806 [Ooceraea biroi]
MLIASASNQPIAPASSVKLRRSRRLSSTRGLKQRSTNIPKDVLSLSCQDRNQKQTDPYAAGKIVDEDGARGRLLMNWEVNERISLSSGSSTGLAVRADSKKGIEFGDIRRRVGEGAEPNRETKSSLVRPTLELMNVSGFAPCVDRKHRGSFPKATRDENVLKSDSKYEIDIPSRGTATRKQKRQDTFGNDADDTISRRWIKDKPGDSISKRLELIHELNQKILANYERFQQKSKRSKDAKEQIDKGRIKADKADAEEHIYTEVNKRKSRSTYKANDQKDPNSVLQQDTHNQDARKDLSKDTGRRKDADKSILLRARCERVSVKEPERKRDISRVADKLDRRVVCENTNFSMAVKENFCQSVDEKTPLSICSKSKDRKTRWSAGSSVLRAKRDVPFEASESSPLENCLKNSRLYPTSCAPSNNDTKNDNATTENATTNDAWMIDRSDPRGDAGSRRKEEDEEVATTDEKMLECRILENLDETIDRFDSEGTQLTSTGEEKDSFSTDSIQSGSPSSARGSKNAANLQDTFNSSWDSGVGVDVGNGSGWVRIHTGIESSLVYLTLDTTAKDVCRDMLLGDDLSLFVQVNVSSHG